MLPMMGQRVVLKKQTFRAVGLVKEGLAPGETSKLYHCV